MHLERAGVCKSISNRTNEFMDIMEKTCIWTLDGDETSWASWAEAIGSAEATPLMHEMIEAYGTSEHGWAIDLGCGTGRAFFPLVQAGYRVIGIDPVRRSIQLSRKRVAREGFQAFPLQASAAQLPLRNDSTAFVFAIGSLFHLSDRELMLALQEIYRILEPQGKAILHFLDLGDWRRSLAPEIHPEEAPDPSYRAVVTCFSSEESIVDGVTKAGLMIESAVLKTSQSEAGEQQNWLVSCRK